MLQAYLAIGALALYCLNPFEVREVLQVISGRQISYYPGLNPFEVREVLQADNVNTGKMNPVSIPLKSGRCCKVSTLTTTL